MRDWNKFFKESDFDPYLKAHIERNEIYYLTPRHCMEIANNVLNEELWKILASKNGLKDLVKKIQSKKDW